MKQRIKSKILQSMSVEFLEVSDVSHHHVGHAGWRDDGETHFKIKLVSSSFIGMNQIARHRMIYAILAAELQDKIHALQLQLETPEET
jgi:BolA protein